MQKLSKQVAIIIIKKDLKSNVKRHILSSCFLMFALT